MPPEGGFFVVLHPIEWGGRDPPLQDRIEASREQPFGCCKALRAGPPLQGDFVRRVVPRPAPTRGRGTSGLHTNAIRSDEIPLQRRPSRRGVPRTAAAPARSRWTPTHSTWPDPAPLNREKNQKKGPATSRRSFEMARPERFELPTAWFVARYSIQLSYGRVFARRGIMRERPRAVNRFRHPDSWAGHQAAPRPPRPGASSRRNGRRAPAGRRPAAA